MRRLLDRPGDHMGEKGDEAEVIHGVVDGAYPAAVDVDGVAQRLERVERDPDWEDHVEGERIGKDADQAQQAVQIAGEEVEVLKESERAQVRR